MGRRFIIPLLLSLCTLIVSVAGAFFVAETYFFDLLFYRKSSIHGYSSQMYNLSAFPDDWIIESRFKDTRKLITAAHLSQAPDTSHDMYKIAVIGDSLVYGLGVREGQRLTEVLEKKLNAIRPTKVYNLGQSGDSIVDYYTLYKLAQQYLRPDATVIMMVNNDLVFDGIVRYPGETALFEQLHEKCPQEIYSNPDVPLDTNRSEPDASNICILREIALRVASDQRLFFYPYTVFPSVSVNPIAVDEQEEWIMDTYTSTILAAGGRVVLPSNIPGFIYEPVSARELHPSAKTHALWAQSLYKEITENPAFGF